MNNKEKIEKIEEKDNEKIDNEKKLTETKKQEDEDEDDEVELTFEQKKQLEADHKLHQQQMKDQLNKIRQKPPPIVFLDLTVNDTPYGRIEIQLFNSDNPKASENFRCLCTGEKGVSPTTGTRLHYKDTRIFKILPNFILQGGDITKNDGTGGESIYGDVFEDEPFQYFTKPYLVGMANMGAHSNSNHSQFFITTVGAKNLNNKNVCVGKVTKGKKLLEKLQKLGNKYGEVSKKIVIANCGEIRSEQEITTNMSKEVLEEKKENVFLEIGIDGESVGKIVIEVFKKN